MTAVSAQSLSFDPAALERLLDGRYGELRRELRAVLSEPEFAPVVGLPTAEYREQVLAWAKSLAERGLTAPGFPERYGGRGDPGAACHGRFAAVFAQLVVDRNLTGCTA